MEQNGSSGSRISRVWTAARIVAAVTITALSAPLILFGLTILLDLALGTSFRRCITRFDFWTLIALYSLLIPTPLILAQRIAKWEMPGVIVAVLFYLGFAFYFVPNLFDAMTRGQAKRTMADIRSIGTAIEAYAADYDALPHAHNNVDVLAALLEPRYIKTLPRVDGWRTPIVYLYDGENYWIVSYGACGRPDIDDPTQRTQGARPGFKSDIVFSDGQFISWSKDLYRCD